MLGGLRSGASLLKSGWVDEGRTLLLPDHLSGEGHGLPRPLPQAPPLLQSLPLVQGGQSPTSKPPNEDPQRRPVCLGRPPPGSAYRPGQNLPTQALRLCANLAFGSTGCVQRLGWEGWSRLSIASCQWELFREAGSGRARSHRHSPLLSFEPFQQLPVSTRVKCPQVQTRSNGVSWRLHFCCRRVCTHTGWAASLPGLSGAHEGGLCPAGFHQQLRTNAPSERRELPSALQQFADPGPLCSICCPEALPTSRNAP